MGGTFGAEVEAGGGSKKSRVKTPAAAAPALGNAKKQSGKKSKGKKTQPGQQLQVPETLAVDDYVGRRVMRYWPGDGWVEGFVTDYKADSNEHVITYDFNTADESYEYFDIRQANDSEIRVLSVNKEAIVKMAPDGGGAAQPKRGLPKGGGKLTGLGPELDKISADIANTENVSRLNTIRADILQREEQAKADLARLVQEESRIESASDSDDSDTDDSD